MRRLGFWLILILAIVGAWLTLPRTENRLPNDYASLTPPTNFDSVDSIAAGREIFLASCAACHGVNGNGQGAVKPTFGLKPSDFTDRTQTQRRTPQYLFWRMSEGGQSEPFRAQGSIMPAWKFQLSEQQRWQMVAYLLTLAR